MSADSVPPPHNAAQDLVLLHSRTPDGEGIRVLRARDGRVETGEVRPIQEGQSIVGGEIVQLKPRPENPSLCDVVVQYEAPGGQAKSVQPHKGPALLNSPSYREHWETIFEKPHTRTLN